MYGYLDSVDNDKHFVHNMITRFGLFKDGTNVQEKFNKQIVVNKMEDEEEDFSNADSILKFINKNSKYGKMVRELEHFADTVSHTIYKITGSED